MNIELKIGTVIEYKNGLNVWVESTITKESDSFVWFKGSGVQRVAKQTFINWPTLFRIKQNGGTAAPNI
jgi:hypothetical protein